MTDPRESIGRVDLRALDLERDQTRENNLVAGVMARLQPRPPDVIPLLMVRRYLAIGAAVLAAIAALTVLQSRGRDADGDALLMTWTTSGHVPTNGELLAAYQGYRP
jgi:hypothetical protein